MSYPTVPPFNRVSTKLRHYNLTSESLNGRIQVRSLGSSRREFTIGYPPMTREAFEPVYEFIAAQGGMLGTFTIDIADPAVPGTKETITARLAGDVQEYAVTAGMSYTFEVDIVEVV